MSASITGVDDIIRRLKNEFGSTKFSRIENEALKKGAKKVALSIHNELVPFKDTGATVDEIVVGSPTTRGGFKHILVGWKGPKDRYRLVHLNEFGYTKDGKRYHPRAKGAIQRAVDNSRQNFFDAVANELRKRL